MINVVKIIKNGEVVDIIRERDGDVDEVDTMLQMLIDYLMDEGVLQKTCVELCLECAEEVWGEKLTDEECGEICSKTLLMFLEVLDRGLQK